MDNCWFRLKQTHFPPPSLPGNAYGVGKGNGAICPGHVLPSLADLDHMDNIINRSLEGFSFTPEVPLCKTRAWNMEWKEVEKQQAGISAGAKAPIAEFVGLTAQAKVALAFKESVENYRSFDKLDRYIILPTRAYINDMLEDKEVESHIERRKSLGAWSVIIITGVAIARGSKGSISEEHERSGNLGGELNFADAVSVGSTIDGNTRSGISMSTGAESDFIWAVRVSKIWKGMLDRTWSFRTQSKGATFSLEDQEQKKNELTRMLDMEGKGDTKKLWIDEEDGILVL